MLTKLEYEQIRVALKMAHVYRINFEDYINRHNALALLQAYIEPGEDKPCDQDESEVADEVD